MGRSACLPAPERSGLESGVHETKRRRDGGWSPDGSAGVHEADLRRRDREDVRAPRPDAARRVAGGADRPQRGQGEQGYYVYDVWESREAFERFMEEKLGPAIAEVMAGPPPEGGAPQYFPINVLVIPG